MPETHPIVQVGLIGYGFAGKTFHAPLITSVAGLELCAVATRQAESVAVDLPDVEVDQDPTALIAGDDLDLIVIATPNDTHAPLARAAIEAGKHVVIDKPFALDLAEARGLIVLAEQHGVTLSVFHNRRWDSDFLAGQKAIAGGMVGTVSHF